MTGRDEILDRIDDVLAGDDQHIGIDWSVSGDAMRSRPVTEDDRRPATPRTIPHGSIDAPASSIVAQAARMVADREQAVARLAAVTNPIYAHEIRLTTGGDVRQLELITRLHAAHGFTEQTRGLVRYAHNNGIDALSIARVFDVPDRLVAGGLPEPRPNLRLQLIDALGLAPVLTRMCEWLVGALERIQPVLARLDPRPSARRRRRDVSGVRTISVALTADTTAFNDAMQRVGVSAAEAGANMAAAMDRLFGPGYQDPDETTAEDIRRQRRDRAEICAIARTELTAARRHLDRQVDAIYDDLDLVRDPHLTRGEH